MPTHPFDVGDEVFVKLDGTDDRRSTDPWVVKGIGWERGQPYVLVDNHSRSARGIGYKLPADRVVPRPAIDRLGDLAGSTQTSEP